MRYSGFRARSVLPAFRSAVSVASSMQRRGRGGALALWQGVLAQVALTASQRPSLQPTTASDGPAGCERWRRDLIGRPGPAGNA
jgi:hypothetical protein